MTHPAQWTVRARSAVAAALVVTVGLVVAGAAMLLVLYTTLERSTEDAANARARQIVLQLRNDPPADLDRGLLATDGQVGVIQLLDRTGAVVAASLGAPTAPLVRRTTPPAESVSLGRVHVGVDGDYWLSAHGATSPAGPVTILVGGNRTPVVTVMITVSKLLAIGGPMLIALITWATYRLVGASLHPVEQIRSRVSSISSGQLNERVPVPPSGDEIAHLAETMNDMLTRLESGHTAQRRFVSDASHELRSPLATITAALELAHHRPDMLDAALIDESLLPEAHRMGALLQDLLLLARAEERHLSLRAVDVDVDDLLRDERTRLQAVSGLTVRTSITPVRVTGDPGQLTRVIRNLIDNAVRYARHEISLACHLDGDVAVIEISDDGPGIPPAQRDYVFERFARLDVPRTRATGGTGLGLAIVAEIVAAHHGNVLILDADPGGARFVVRLPADVGSYLCAETNR